jgi:hypothetical protein
MLLNFEYKFAYRQFCFAGSFGIATVRILDNTNETSL